jgi:competence protein ComFC
MSYPGPVPPSRARERVEPWLGRFMKLLYPLACRSCDLALPAGDELDGLHRWLCQRCMGDLVRVEAPFCENCGEPFEGAISGAFTCANCAGRRFAFDFAISRFRSEGPVRELIHDFKYGHDLSLRSVLSGLLQEVLEDSRLQVERLGEWVLVPVPLHRSRMRQRGFNQSAEICRALSRETGIPTLDALSRNRQTDAQASLHRGDRLENLRNAFTLRKSWFGAAFDLKKRKVLLVDDVLTTGATSHECAKVLKRDGGAEKVVVITVARG